MKNISERWIAFSLAITSSVFLALAGGCGQSSSSSSTTTTTMASASIVLSGTLNTGTISGAGVRSFGAVASYNLVAIDNATGKTYHGSTDASGTFSLEVPGGSSYEISLVDDDSKYFGPIVMVGGAASSEVVMGIAPSADLNLGEIVVDTTKEIAKPVTEPVSAALFSDTAEATAGVPKGAGSCGKEHLAGLTTREGSADMDRDGIPDIFDADEDDDGIRKGIISTFKTPLASNTVEAFFISSNIWARHGTTDEAKDQIAMWLNVTAIDDDALNLIQSVEVIDVPSSIKDVATIRFSTSIGDPIGYPAENSLWKDSGYYLYKTTTLPSNRFIVSLCPRAIMSVGDTFTVRVIYTDGAYQDFFLSTAYVLTDWARVLTYNGASLPDDRGTQTSAETFSTDSLEIVFSKPLDEDGNILEGLTYSIRVGTVESISPYGVAPNATETRLTDSGGSTITAVISTLTAETYYICPVAESADGQRNGEETWFTRQ